MFILFFLIILCFTGCILDGCQIFVDLVRQKVFIYHYLCLTSVYTRCLICIVKWSQSNFATTTSLKCNNGQ